METKPFRVSTDDLRQEAGRVRLAILEKTPLWRMKPARSLLIEARTIISAMSHRLHEFQTENWSLKRQVETLVASLKHAQEQAKEARQVAERIQIALYEMEKDKGSFRTERPFAILLSPAQLAAVKLGRDMFVGLGWNRHKTGHQITEFAGLPCYTASGVYGPVVVTERAFNAITRQAPELLIKSI